MKEKTKVKTGKVLAILAAVSMVIATLEGMVFYQKFDNIFFRILLTIQNSIKAFVFRSDISLKDISAMMKENPTVFNVTLGYVYGVILFVAPYCTFATLYRLLEYLFRFVFVFKKMKGDGHIVIFGYNDDVAAMLERNGAENENYCIHIVTAGEIKAEKRYALRKAGYVLHFFDFLRASEKELSYLLKKVSVDKASHIILFEDNSLMNFSLLQMFPLDKSNNEKDNISLCADAKIFCRCEDEDVARLIADYYDSCKQEETGYDLELINLPELQIHKMYNDIPLHKYYEKGEKKLAERNINLLIIGFGKVGQQALLQAMNLGVVHQNNAIRIDVIDYDIERKAEIFANRFSKKMFEMEENHFQIKNEVADGKFDIFFYNMDVRYQKFQALLERQRSKDFYHYVVVAVNDVDVALHCAMELQKYSGQGESGNVPVVLQMEKDKRLAAYVRDNEGIFSNVSIMPNKKEVLSLDMILNRKLDEKAKEFHHFYSTIKIVEKNYSSVNSQALSAEAMWNKLKLFRRDSNRAVAYHQVVKEQIVECLAKEVGVELDKKLDEMLGKKGTLFVYDGTAWRLAGTEEEFIEQMRMDEFAYAFEAAEHRRWSYFMLSKGWEQGERNDMRQNNPCIVPQSVLEIEQPNMCKYDLMPLMMIYKQRRK